ncbi:MULTISPECIES: asparagine synthase-related protein [unclassified Actinoplanes]|nr:MULTISPECIES: asparagine synthase-related protein [unclassified Actinoplanes]
MPDNDAGHRMAGPLLRTPTGVPGPRPRTPTGVPGMVAHASGRPWLVGRWQPGEAVTAAIGPNRLAALGEHRLTADDLRRLARGARTAEQLCESLRGQPGSFHVIAAGPDGLAVQGSLSGFRRVYHHGPLAGDRADVLAAVIGAGVDDEALAVRLLSPFAPWPLFWNPVFHRIAAVRPDERLVVAPDGTPRLRRRWQPPAPTVDPGEAATWLRDALAAAVAVRGAPGDVLASDLSGMDSTSLCALAVRDGRHVIGLTCVSPDPLDDDLPWAETAARELGKVTHEVIAGDASPLPYTDLHRPADGFDEPTAAVMYRAGFLGASRRAAGHGARVRLTGFGGDELLTADPALQLSLLRTDPRAAIRNLRLLRSAYRWGRTATLRAAFDRRPYGTWLASLTGDGDAGAGPMLGWGPPAALAPWVSPDARATVRRILREQAASATPLLDDRGLHGRLAGLHAGAAAARHLAQASRRTGVTVALPYLDDAVVEAALSVRLAGVASPRQYKPLLALAMRDVLPEPVRHRSTKADTSIAALRGADEHRGTLLDLADRSQLADRGLIDAAALRAALTAPGDRTFYDLDQTLAAEAWLRVPGNGDAR